MTSPRGTSPARRRGASPPRRGARAAPLPATTLGSSPLLPPPPPAVAPAAPPPPPTRLSPRVALALALGIAVAAAGAGAAAGAALSQRQRQSSNTSSPLQSAPLLGAAAAAPPTPLLSLPLLRPPPHVIAHRGASGLLPEHTLPAYAAALAAGADFVECDVHLTADAVPICRHDADLATTTDARERFPQKVRTRTIDGAVVGPGVFACDLTLDEVRTLKAKQRWPQDRGEAHDGAYGVATLDELLRMADSFSGGGGGGGGGDDHGNGNGNSHGRVVGVYPETKHAAWHDALFAERWRRREPRLMRALRGGGGNDTVDNSNGRRLLERAIVSRLLARGYAGVGPVGGDAWRRRPSFVQSFEIQSLRAVEWLAGAGLEAAARAMAATVTAAAGGGGPVGSAARAAGQRAVAGARLPAVLPRARRARAAVGSGRGGGGTGNESSNSTNANANALPLVLLLGGWPGWSTADTGETLEAQLSRLEATWAREVDGAGPWKESLFDLGRKEEVGAAAPATAHHASSSLLHGGDVAAAEETAAAAATSATQLAPPKPSGLLARLKAAGLVVHAYTVRQEARFVVPGFGGDWRPETSALWALEGGGGGGGGGEKLDGAFADYPAGLVGFLEAEGLRSSSAGAAVV